jgi:hypothetical protein
VRSRLKGALDRPNVRYRLLTTEGAQKGGTMIKYISWDVCAATAIAVIAMFFVAILDQSPLLLVVIILALCVYIVVQGIYVREQSGDA